MLDIIALAGFIGAWVGYAITIEWMPFGRQSLNARMNRYREEWVPHPRARDAHGRHADHGGAAKRHRVLRLDVAARHRRSVDAAVATEELILVVSGLPFGIQATRELWEAKTVGLVLIFIMLLQVRLVVSAVQLRGDPGRRHAVRLGKGHSEAAAHVRRTARLFEAAALHFNRGQRAFFFAIGYLGWFVGPVVLMIATVAVLWTMWRRQFACDAMRAVMAE